MSGFDSYGGYGDGSRYGAPQAPEYGSGPHIPEQQGPLPPGQPRPGSGCSKWALGCLIAIVVVAAILAGLGWYGWSKLKGEVLSETPITAEVSEVSRDFRSEMAPVLKAMGKANEEEFTLKMTGSEFSYFVLSVLHNSYNRPDEWKVPGPEQIGNMNVKLRMTVKDGNLLDFGLSLPIIADKYFINVTGVGEIAITDGRLELNLEKVTIGREHFEGAEADRFGKVLRGQFMATPEAGYLLRVVPDLKVDNGNIYMRVRAIPYDRRRTSSY